MSPTLTLTKSIHRCKFNNKRKKKKNYKLGIRNYKL